MKTIITNKQAIHDYQILDKYQAGIILTGPEVKSVKAGNINLKGGYVNIDPRAQVWLMNVHIAPYPPAVSSQINYNPTQSRKLLLQRKEINSLIGKIKTKGLTIVPLKVYLKGGLIKIEIGVGKGKKKWDKRVEIKEREWQRRKKRITDSLRKA